MDTSPKFHDFGYPNESAEYRRARNLLLAEEIELRRQIERVAAQRRALPPGGEVPEDYVFEGADGPVKLSELFGRHPTLVIYNYMFGPQRERPCPACTSVLSAIEGEAQDIDQRVAFVAVARSPMARLAAFASERGWPDLRLVSSAGNDFSTDYFGVLPDGSDIPGWNVFTRRDGKLRHQWGSEMGAVESDPGQNPRAGDMMWPLWNLLDLTPEGRGTDWGPSLTYGQDA